MVGEQLEQLEFVYNAKSHLLKLATIMGIGKVMHNTPQMAHNDPTNLPAAVRGATSPYPRKTMMSSF